MTTQAIGYLRVSTQDQEQSGLGLAAQRTAIINWASANQMSVIGWETDIQTGADNARPGLQQALRNGKILGCPVLVAKLDRLSRRAAYILNLVESGVEFICVDVGRQQEPMMLHMRAMFAEQERLLISQRTKAALAALKAKGKQLGGRRVGAGGNAVGAAKARAKRAEQIAARLAAPMILKQYLMS